jgi:hypothetical protein
MKFSESERRIYQAASTDKNRISELESTVQQLRTESQRINVDEIRCGGLIS